MPHVPNPAVIESDGRVERSMDVYSRLLRDRIIYLGTPVDDDVANLIIAQLLYLASADPDRDIQMYINSPGGQVDAGLAIYDTMHLIQPKVATTCIGMAASMGAVLLGGGAKGKRSALPNSRILIHQTSAGFQGTAVDIEVQAREIIRMNARLQEMMAADTGQSVERIAGDALRELTRESYFIVSKVLPSHASFDGVMRACEGTLERMRIDYLDCYLLHWRGGTPLEPLFSRVLAAG